MPTYFEKLTAAKHASAVKASPTRPPPMRLHVDENTGLNRDGLDYVDPMNKTRGSASLPPFTKPVLERDDVDGTYYVSENRAYESTGTQAAPELATRFHLERFTVDEQNREGMGPNPFVRASFDVVAEQDNQAAPYTYVDHAKFKNVMYDEIIDPYRAEKSPFAIQSPMANGLEKDPSAPPAFGAYAWTSLDAAHPGTNTMRFDVDPSGGPPKMHLHPGLKEWFGQISHLRPRGHGDRMMLAKLQGGAIAHLIRELESPGSGQAMKAAIDGELARYIKEAGEGAARESALRDTVAQLETKLANEISFRVGVEAERETQRALFEGKREELEDLLAIEDVAQVLKEIAEAEEAARLQAEEEERERLEEEQWLRDEAARKEEEAKKAAEAAANGTEDASEAPAAE